MKDYKSAKGDLLAMYIDYCQELAQYDSHVYPPGQDEKIYGEYEKDPNCVIHYIEVDGNAAGFLMTITPDAYDLVIAEAYMKPEYRGKGWMRDAVYQAIVNHPKCYILRLMTFNKNEKALPYWKKTLAPYGFELSAQEDFNEDITEYFFTRDTEK